MLLTQDCVAILQYTCMFRNSMFKRHVYCNRRHLALFELLTSYWFQVLHQEHLYKYIDCKHFLQSSIFCHTSNERIKMFKIPATHEKVPFRLCLDMRAARFCTQYRSRIRELTISLRFLGIILRVLRLEVSVFNVYITNQFQPTFAGGKYSIRELRWLWIARRKTLKTLLRSRIRLQDCISQGMSNTS